MLKRCFVGTLLAGIFALAAAGGCNCGKDVGGLEQIPPWSCDLEGRRPGPEDVACPEGKRFVKGVCDAARCDATDTPNCCPGMFCTSGGVCQVPPSRVTTCDDDSGCEAGLRCLTRPRVHADSKSCGFMPVDATGACPEGGQAFNRRCVEAAPCGGFCSEGSVCNIDTNRCEEPPSLANEGNGCAQSCGGAALLVYADPDSMLFDQCCTVTCECLTLPRLPFGNWGRFSDLAVAADGILVSAYDSTYGDLVLARMDRLSGQLDTLEYIDGVPSSGTPVADPSGPRGGRDGPGPDVGQYTSLALAADGSPRVVYYDVEGGNLKWAAWQSNVWSISVVDDDGDQPDDTTDGGDVGRFTSLVIDASGIPHVTYYAHRATPSGVLVTTPMYARATSALPAGPADWIRVPVDPIRSCNNTCNMDEICVDEGGVPTCRPEATTCSACACDEACVSGGCAVELAGGLEEPCGRACSSTEACVADLAGGTECLPETTGCSPGCSGVESCVSDGVGAVCRPSRPYSTLVGLPEGNGLFTSLAIVNDVPHVVYYDRLRGILRGAVAAFTGSEDPLAGFAVMPPLVCDPLGDDGQHASLAVAPDGSLAVAYQSNDGETLWYWSGADFLNGSAELVDGGLRAGGRINLVGASASLAFDADGVPYIAYQDQTDNNLLINYKPAADWTRRTVLSGGAFGSFARLAIDGRVGYVSTYQRERDARDRDISKLVLRILDLDNLAALPE